MHETTARFEPLPFETDPLYLGVSGPAGAAWLSQTGVALRAGGAWRLVPVEWPRFVVGTPDGFVGAAPSGPSWRLDLEGRLAFGPEAAGPGPGQRLNQPALAWDPEAGRLLLFGGTDFLPGRQRDQSALWAWRDGAWRKLKTSGRVTARSGALAAWTPGLGLVARGGFTSSKGVLEETLHFDGQAWTVFASPPPPELVNRMLVLLAWDAPARQLLAALPGPDFALHLQTYRGRGVWQPLGRVLGVSEARMAYDGAARRLVFVRGTASPKRSEWAEVDLAPWLAGLPPPEA